MTVNEINRKCPFTPRMCPFDTDEIPLEVCLMCIDAWKSQYNKITITRQKEKIEPERVEEEISLSPLRTLDRYFIEDKIDRDTYMQKREEILSYIRSRLNSARSEKKDWEKILERAI